MKCLRIHFHMRVSGLSSPSPSQLPTECTVSVLIIAELARGAGGTEISYQISVPGRDLNPEPLDWLSSTLTTRLPCSRTPANKENKRGSNEY